MKVKVPAKEPGKPAPPPAAGPLPFSVADIQKAIPKHCWERSMVTSFGYLFKDLSFIAVLGYMATFISALPLWARFLAWPAYWFAQGIMFTGVWVLAHECGHQAFTASKLVNDAVGWVLHSSLLVPYFSWAISHSQHHKYTCSMDDDEVFVPQVRSAFTESISESPIAAAIQVVIMATVGWPGYLISNFSGPHKYAGKANSHFNPYSALYNVKQRFSIFLSDIGFFMAVGALCYASYLFGPMTVFCFYGIPYMINNFYLVTITYLQHTDTYVPHYRSGEFTWLKGALSTVDRSIHPLIDTLLHNINDTHVVHHLFSQMPHYHAEEATRAVKKLLGPYYLKDETPFLQALWNTVCKCKYVDDEGQIVYLKSAADFNRAAKKAQ